MVLVSDATQLCPCRKTTHRQYIDEWLWLYSNKTLFVKQAMRQIWLPGLDDRTLLWRIWSSRHTFDLEESFFFPPQYDGTLLWFFPCPSPFSLVFLLIFPILTIFLLTPTQYLVTLKVKGCTDPVAAKLLCDFAEICHHRWWLIIRQSPCILLISTKLSFRKQTNQPQLPCTWPFVNLFCPFWVLSQSLFLFLNY